MNKSLTKLKNDKDSLYFQADFIYTLDPRKYNDPAGIINWFIRSNNKTTQIKSTLVNSIQYNGMEILISETINLTEILSNSSSRNKNPIVCKL